MLILQVEYVVTLRGFCPLRLSISSFSQALTVGRNGQLQFGGSIQHIDAKFSLAVVRLEDLERQNQHLIMQNNQLVYMRRLPILLVHHCLNTVQMSVTCGFRNIRPDGLRLSCGATFLI